MLVELALRMTKPAGILAGDDTQVFALLAPEQEASFTDYFSLSS